MFALVWDKTDISNISIAGHLTCLFRLSLIKDNAQVSRKLPKLAKMGSESVRNIIIISKKYFICI